ncbi:MAG: hypothetical protein RLY30_638 [Pseudomonadota bacterium]
MQTQIVPESNLPPNRSELLPPIQTLYFRGELARLGDPTIAIVGSRKAGTQGCAHARQMASSLAEQGITVVSGLALGIDAAAHRGALRLGRTIAVLAHGLDLVYPEEHRGLAREILDAGGLLLSEYADGVTPRPHFFLHRNRLIAWASLGIVVIEAGHRSGALSTALAALDLGREVMVLPGPVSGGYYSGGHRLIRDGAHLVESAQEVLSVCGQARLPLDPSPQPAGQRRPDSQDPRAHTIAAVLDFQPNDPADLCQRSGLTMADLMAGLLLLELEGFAHRRIDGRWSRRP